MTSRIEQIGDATLYLGDCREIALGLSADVVITDPPYGMSRHISGHKVIARLGSVTGDDEPFDPAICLATGTEHIIWGANHFASRLSDQTRWLMWQKHDASLFGKRSTAPFELAWTDLGGAGRAIRWIWDGSIRQGERAGTEHCHPTEKPIEVMAWCVGLTGLIGEGRVLDPFMGSGTTGIATLRLGRKFIGIEIEERWFDAACRRIEAETRQARFAV